ncbi:MAG: redox-regulated ATPase YchF [Anaerolineales bacterium]|nr:redox-regulated ATPase YchF [Anaerolineales bacterium]
MRLGIIGLPQSGKTTIFNALTRGDRPTAMTGGRVEVHTAVVDVPDTRLDRLVEIYHPKKISPAKVIYADIAGLNGSANGNSNGNKGEISGELINHLATMDGFLHVVRCFPDESVAHIMGSVDPQRDIANMDTELLLSDLIVVERKLERLGEERKKGGRDKAAIEREQELFTRLQAHLSEEKPLREMELTPEELKSLSSYSFLTLRPMLVVLNLAEGQDAPDVSGVTSYDEVVALQGQLEMEIAQLLPDEAKEFLQEYGITEPSLNRMIQVSYDLLGLQSFFTVGEDDCHAWTVERGSTARRSAGTIHSDLEKGFIRAEVVSYEDLSSLGSLAKAREAGKLRVEGKEYIVKDGEIMHVLFNV